MAENNVRKDVGSLSWQCVGAERDLRRKKCQHLFAKSKKKDDLVLICHKERFYAMTAWCGHLGNNYHV